MIAALVTAAAVWLAWRPPAARSSGVRELLARDAALVVLTWLAFGPLVGVVAAFALRVLIPRLAAIDDREPVLDEPAALELIVALAVCHSAGVSGAAAWRAAVDAVGELPAATCRTLIGSLELGVPYDEALREMAAVQPALQQVCHTLRRAHATGSPVAGALAEAARQCAADGHSAVLRRVRQLGVRAALPLGLCFLPAFVLIGVVPLVAGLL